MNVITNVLKSCVILALMGILMKNYYTLFFSLDKQPKAFMKKQDWLTAATGTHVVPVQAQIAAALIDSMKVSSYQPVGQIVLDADGFVLGCLSQTAWPARMDSTSRTVVGYQQDLLKIPGVTINYNYEGICIGRY